MLSLIPKDAQSTLHDLIRSLIFHCLGKGYVTQSINLLRVRLLGGTTMNRELVRKAERRERMFNEIQCHILILVAVLHSTTGNVGSWPADIAYEAEKRNLSNIASIFSPRMDFDQWKPLTGRGDPLRNDPTYDYEPPLLERVHYWADETRLEREHYPDRKSEVLMLGVSSRRPSMGSRLPSIVPRKHHRPPPPSKYEDYTYKLSDRFPMTILVPPPPPPPVIPAPFVKQENKIPTTSQTKLDPLPVLSTNAIVTDVPEQVTTSFALQEANLIYQTSTTNVNNWIQDQNNSQAIANGISSDYAGWGPTTSTIESNIISDTHNLILNDPLKSPYHPYSFYKPVFSEAPPPIQFTPSSLPSSFVPTIPPTTLVTQSEIVNDTQATRSSEKTTVETLKEINGKNTTTEMYINYQSQSTPNPLIDSTPEKNIIDMLGPMMSMPLMTGPERPEDNLYAHASELLQVFKENPTEDFSQIETMQTMQPPPPAKLPENTVMSSHPHYYNGYTLSSFKQQGITHDPYLNMRFTTPMSTLSSMELSEVRSTTEPPLPTYLIIQGHSKVKTYSSKPNFNDDHEINNEVSKPKETNEVKHLHPIKEDKSHEKISHRIGKSHSDLKALVEDGLGSIEIQETDLGIKYDVSDGSEVPVEIYKKGIVDSDENAYQKSYKNIKNKRGKRQIDLEDILPFDEDSIEEYVYNYFDGKKNETSITGLIAQAVTSDAAAVVDDLEDDDEDTDDEER